MALAHLLGHASVLLALAAGDWRVVAPGLEIRTAHHGEVALEAMRLDLTRVRLRVVLAGEIGKEAARVEDLVEGTGALAAVNGGFFDESFRPVGLRVSGGRTVAGSLRRGLGALVVTGAQARVVMGSSIEALPAGSEVVQCGPRLVIGGRPNRLKNQRARRSMIGIDRQGRIVIVVTARGELLASDAARLLSGSEEDGGFGLEHALNLDGGGSSQLYVRAGSAEVAVGGVTPVADALAVFPRADPPVAR